MAYSIGWLAALRDENPDDAVVDLMITTVEDAGLEVPFLPDSFVEWYPHTSEAGLIEVVRDAVIAGAPHLVWDSVDDYGVGSEG